MKAYSVADDKGTSEPNYIVKLRCPACRQRGTFDPLSIDDQRFTDPEGNWLHAGVRCCPDADCQTLVFFIDDEHSLTTFPPEVLDFDATDVPKPVADALTEAVTCHAAGCFVAAGIMVRKTLEELCHDRQAKGGNLKERIRNLRSTVVLPDALLNGLDDLRLLGNDAAHVESETFKQVGREEVEVSIEFTKEVLKAVYQYDSLLQRLQNLKNTSQ